jgi:hypothetical protein
VLSRGLRVNSPDHLKRERKSKAKTVSHMKRRRHTSHALETAITTKWNVEKKRALNGDECLNTTVGHIEFILFGINYEKIDIYLDILLKKTKECIREK